MTERWRISGFAHGAICQGLDTRAPTHATKRAKGGSGNVHNRAGDFSDLSNSGNTIAPLSHGSSHGPLYPEAQKLSAPVSPPLQASGLRHARMLSLSVDVRQYPPSMLSVCKVRPAPSAVVCSNGASHVGVWSPISIVQPRHSSQSGQSKHTASKRAVLASCGNERDVIAGETYSLSGSDVGFKLRDTGYVLSCKFALQMSQVVNLQGFCEETPIRGDGQVKRGSRRPRKVEESTGMHHCDPGSGEVSV